MGEHICQCENCAPPGTFPDGERQGDGHYAKRFGDLDGETGRYLRTIDAYCDGEKVMTAFETLTGECGFAVYYPESQVRDMPNPGIHECATCVPNRYSPNPDAGLCIAIRYGVVELRVKEGVPA